ncbi:hypothetical protein F5Y18DRAFT_287190 [Xylariaceae sp. FL1019]|nr:hypothetical protein F5Y18DRAFT_287190 [Xylariaceae sp. FL1019]
MFAMQPPEHSYSSIATFHGFEQVSHPFYLNKLVRLPSGSRSIRCFLCVRKIIPKPKLPSHSYHHLTAPTPLIPGPFGTHLYHTHQHTTQPASRSIHKNKSSKMDAGTGGFSKDLIIGIVATVVSVILFFGLILVLALWWQSIARRVMPNRFAEPPSEKAWPQSRYSTDTNLTMMSSPNASPRSSAALGSSPSIQKAVLKR